MGWRDKRERGVRGRSWVEFHRISPRTEVLAKINTFILLHVFTNCLRQIKIRYIVFNLTEELVTLSFEFWYC